MAADLRPGLVIDRLTKRYANVTAVSDLSFRADRGSILALLGPNGAGKTTTLLCLAGLVRPDQGRVFFDGRELGPDRGRSIALIPETPEVYPMLTVWEHLVFVAKSCRLPGDWMARGRDLLERLGMTESRDTLGSELSKGMRQKTLIAATVLVRAPALLLDEPMIGLDPRGQRELRSILLDLKAQNTAVVVSTHLLESAETISDRVVILKSGKSVAEGSIDQLRSGGESGRSLEDLFLEITQ